MKPSLSDLAGTYLGQTTYQGVDFEGDLRRLGSLLVRVHQMALEEAALVADRAALERPQNRRLDNPLATYQAGACRAAYLIRARARAALDAGIDLVVSRP